MRRKVSLLLIVMLLLILSVSMIACDKGSQGGGNLPDEINPGQVDNGGNDDAPTSASLKFEFTDGPNSVLSAPYVEDFNVGKVLYYIEYVSSNKLTTASQKYQLTEDMIYKITDSSVLDENNNPKDLMEKDENGKIVWKKGHYMIWVRKSVGDDSTNYIQGTFALHLQNKPAQNEQVSLTFKLTDDNNRKATAYFGTTSADGTTVTVRVAAGIEFATWTEFTDTFRMTVPAENGKYARVLQSVSVNNKNYGESTSNFPLTIDKTFDGKTFNTKWSDDTFKVTFDVAVPADAVLEDGKTAPADNPDFKAEQTVGRGDKAVMPSADIFSVYYGYSFAGWYDVSTDKLWNFAKPITSDVTLKARWSRLEYSLTLYTMGGEFKSNLDNVEVNGKKIESAEDAAAENLTVVTAESSFGIESGKLTKIKFSGFAYGHQYSEYVAKVEITPQKSVYIRVSEIADCLVKGNGGYVKVDGIYADYQCEIRQEMMIVDGKNSEGYVKWVFNDTDDPAERLKRMSAYYTEVVFKDGLSIKADGSIRIDKIADESVSELIIPAELEYKGRTRPVTEISAKSCMNLKALTKIDFSSAYNLKSIGELAFAHAPHLRELLGTTGNIERVGKNAFYGSEFENNYFYTHDGKQFIVLGSVLYKFVGQEYSDGEAISLRADLVQRLDISVSEYYTAENTPNLDSILRIIYNEQLQNATTVADGAFANATALKTIKLGNNIQRIENNAFANLSEFSSVEVDAESSLAYVGEKAFDGTSMLKETSGNYRSNYSAIVIGKVYYRFLDKKATQASILSDIEHIAPHAFEGCQALEKLSIGSARNVKTIGKGAFTSTKWIQNTEDNENGFVVFNGMLVEYFTDSYGKESTNITIPSNAKSIGEETFYQYANGIKTIKFGTNVEVIEDYAFKGASAIESFIFTDVSFKDGKLVGAPYVYDNAFANANGELIHNAKFYFTQSVLTELARVADSSSQDQTTLAWARLYGAHKDNFVVEDVQSVYINTEVISTTLLKTEAGKNAFDSNYGDTVKDGLVLLNNTGVDGTIDLNKTKNNVQVIEITKDDAKYGSLYKEGLIQYVVTFTYNGSTDGCQINVGDPHLYVATVVNAIMGNPSFYDENNDAAIPTIDVISKDANYYLKGFEGQGEDTGSSTPLFYTSFSGGEYKFVYTDINGKKQELPIEKIENFVTSRVTSSSETAIVTIDFYGLGKYKFKFDYDVAVSKVKDIEQDGAISILLNSNAVDALGKFNVRLIGQDGSVTLKALTSANGFTFAGNSSIDTKTLGIHNIRVSYANDGISMTLDIVYSVVLEADASLFEYGYVDQIGFEADGEVFAGTARITSCRATNAETIVLPTTWTDSNGNKYMVTEIGDTNSSRGVFEGFDKLKAIYIAANIKKINARTFANCTALEDIFSAQKVDTEYVKLEQDNFTRVFVSESDTEIVFDATIDNLNNVSLVDEDGRKVFAVAAQYVFTTGGKRVVYNVVGINSLTFEDNDVEVFLPDTLVTDPVLTNADGTSAVANVYSSKSGVIFRTLKYVNDKVDFIGVSAFEGCSGLKSIDLSHATGLQTIMTKAFAGSGLKSIDLSKNTALKEINASVFEGCRSLETVVLPQSVTTIASHAFYNCANLTAITGVTEVENLEDGAFEGCNLLVTKPSKKA